MTLVSLQLRKRSIEESSFTDRSSSNEEEIQQIVQSILDPTNNRGHQEIRELLDLFASKATPGRKSALTECLVVLFQDVVDRKERGRICDTAKNIAKSQINDVLEQALPFLQNTTDGFQRAAILHAISNISVKDRPHVLEFAARFLTLATDGYHLASIIRVIHEIPKKQRASIFATAEPLLEDARDGLHVASILRALHTTNCKDPSEYLLSSVGDPEVESLLEEWDLEIDDITIKEASQLEAIGHSLDRGEVPPHLHIGEISEALGKGLFAKIDIKKGDVIGVYSGILELVSKNDQTFNSYTFNLTSDIDEEGCQLSEDQMHCITRAPVQEEISTAANRFTKGEGFGIQINGEFLGNYTRYLNHGNANVDYNFTRLANGRVEVLIIASKNIKAGDQLLLDYGARYWKLHGVQPREVFSDTYRLVGGRIVETPAVQVVDVSQDLALPSAKSAASKSRPAMMIELENPQLAKKVRIDTSDPGLVSPPFRSTARRRVTQSVSKCRRKAAEQLENPPRVQRMRLRNLSTKRHKVPTAEYQAYRRSLGFKN
jgi:hypothetical protein